MILMITHIHTIGYLLTALALIHIIFPKYFNWKTELQHLSLVNRQMVGVHTFFIAFVVLLMGLLCLSSAKELISTNLGKILCLGLTIFWGTRLFFQLFIYSTKLWKGKTFETTVHIIFTILWIYISTVFLKIYLYY